jgi:hypothetical protein
MDTLLLDTEAWDLCVDAYGNIAMATNPYALAQDAASAIRTFKGEVYYGIDQGVPYFQSVFRGQASFPLVKAELVAAAMTVPEVTAATAYVTSFEGRSLGGQVQISAGGTVVASAFNVGLPQ